jgi:hypothetical protein
MKLRIIPLMLAIILVHHSGVKGNEVDENAIIQQQVAKEITKEDSQAEGDASHGTAYKSIISHYYTNDPYFGEAGPSKASRSGSGSGSDALQKLKRIIAVKRKRVASEASSRMSEGQTIHRSMIPAPLLARVKSRMNSAPYAEEREDFTHGIPAPLLVGGAYRRGHEPKGMAVVKKIGLQMGSEAEDDAEKENQMSRQRMHLKKTIKKRRISE